jgi:hypothetical protein
MREIVALQIAPDPFDVVQFRGIFREPLDGEPRPPVGKRLCCQLTGVDRAVIEDENHRLARPRRTRPRAIRLTDPFEQRDEVGATLSAVRATTSHIVAASAAMIATFLAFPALRPAPGSPKACWLELSGHSLFLKQGHNRVRPPDRRPCHAPPRHAPRLIAVDPARQPVGAHTPVALSDCIIELTPKYNRVWRWFCLMFFYCVPLFLILLDAGA